MKISTLVAGEHALHTEVLRLLPLVVEHLQPLDAQKVLISTGRSAKAKQVMQAFHDACRTVSANMQVFVELKEYSSWITFKISRKDPEYEHGCNYFTCSYYVGTVKGTDFQYEFNIEKAKADCSRVLNTTAQDLERTLEYAKDLTAQLAETKASVPHQFQSIFKYL